MKQLIILFPFILFGSYPLISQTATWDQVPEEVLTALLVRHPDARDVAWSHSEDDYLQARFRQPESDLLPRHALFTRSGDWVETRTEVNPVDLPDEVVAAQKGFYRGYTVAGAYLIMNKRYAELYELHLTKRNAPKEIIRVNPQGYLVTHVPRL